MEEDSIFDEILDKLSQIMENLGQLERDIKDYKSSHRENITLSIEILSHMKLSFEKNLLKLLLSKDLKEVNHLIDTLTKHVETLHIFALSEIAHRKLGKIQFELSNRFFFKETRKKYREYAFELERLDHKASSETVENIKDTIESYEDLIRRSRMLKGDLADEKNRGFIGFLGKLIPWGIATVSSLYVLTTEYLQIDPKLTILALVLLVACVSIFLVFWTQISYGLRALVRSKFVLGVLGIAYVLFFLVFIPRSQNLEAMYSFLFASISFTALIFIVYLPHYADEYRRFFLDRKLDRIKRQFFREDDLRSLLVRIYGMERER